MNRTHRRVAIASGVAVGLLLPHLTELLTSPYDSWTHVFFASHYLHGWFSALEMRWYLGFPVTGYPPLAHQLIAVGSVPFLLIGWAQARALGASYVLLATALTALYPVGIYLFGQVMTSKRAASYGALVAAVFSGWWVLLLGYGQFPTVVASVLTLFGGWALHRALRTERWDHVAVAVLLTALVPMTHHFSAISFLPAVYLVVLTAHASERLDSVRELRNDPLDTLVAVFQPAAVIGGLAVVLALLTVFPFVAFLLNGSSQPVIPHGSRTSWFDGVVWSRPQFWLTLVTGTLFLLLAPLCAHVVRRSRKRNPAMRVAVGVAVICAVLSLGFTTPLPRVLYPGLAESLTYFRFGAWGGFVLLPVVGFVLARLGKRNRQRARLAGNGHLRRSPSIVAIVLLLILASQILVASQVTNIVSPSPDRRASAEQIGEFMSTDKHWRWRYLALGMTQELGLIGVEAPGAQTVDGNYNAGRQPDRVPVLARSRAAQLSSAKFSPAGRRVLSHYLDEHAAYGIKFVFSADRAYAPQLNAAGFTVLYEWPWLDVRVWYDPDVPPTQSTPTEPAQGGGWWMFSWGVVPLVTLVSAGVCAGWSYYRTSPERRPRAVAR
jgi:hypothetical protein